MKELKFNMNYFFKKKELYFMIIFLLLVVIMNIIFVTKENTSRIDDFKETIQTAESLTIFGGGGIWILLPLCLLSIPIFSALIFSDVNWVERKEKMDYLLYNRLSYTKNIIIRFFLTIIGTFLLVFVALMLDYLCLSYLYGNGPILDKVGGAAFNFIPNIDFLKQFSYTNPISHTILCNIHISILFGLLAGFSYTCSFFIKQKVILYFQGPVILLVMEVLFGSINIGGYYLRHFSLLTQLQLSVGEYVNAIVLYIFLFLVSSILIMIHLRKKDVLL